MIIQELLLNGFLQTEDRKRVLDLKTKGHFTALDLAFGLVAVAALLAAQFGSTGFATTGAAARPKPMNDEIAKLQFI